MKCKISYYLLLLVYLNLPVSSAHALKCTPPQLTQTVTDSAITIFEGRAVNVRDLTEDEKESLKKKNIKPKGGDLSDFKAYDVEVITPWKGYAALKEKTIPIVRNTYWGDGFRKDQDYLIVSGMRVGYLYIAYLCGNTMDMQYAKNTEQIQRLRDLIGVGHHIRIPRSDRVCNSDDECRYVQTHCGGCSCGTPVNIGNYNKYLELLEDDCCECFVKEHCEMACADVFPQCIEGVCGGN